MSLRQLALQFSTKGSSKSGNYGHAGRPGKKGGSVAKGMAMDEFAQNWYYKQYDRTDLSKLAKSYPYAGPAYRALIIGQPDYQDANLTEAAKAFLALQSDAEYLDNMFSGKLPSEKFQKAYEKAYLAYAREQIDSYPKKRDVTSWSKSLDGIEYYQQRAKYTLSDAGRVDKAWPDVVMKANVKGVDLAAAVAPVAVTSFHAAQIVGAEEIAAQSVGAYELAYNLPWGDTYTLPKFKI